MLILNSVDKLLEHIKEVQEDVISLSHDSLMKMNGFIEKNNLEVDENITTSLQYQDILTQQLNATIEAIDSMRSSIEVFSHAYKNDENLVSQSMKKLEEKLNSTLQEAKDKKDRFSGKSVSDDADDAIEFF